QPMSVGELIAAGAHGNTSSAFVAVQAAKIIFDFLRSTRRTKRKTRLSALCRFGKRFGPKVRLFFGD
ncbi:MAG TPA: hypothetical protein VGL70_09820, partial [Candidatus Binatia bacterium]